MSRRRLVLAILCGVAGWALGAEMPLAASTPLLVTAPLLAQDESVTRDGSDTTTLTRDQLAALATPDLPTALCQLPGVTVCRPSVLGNSCGGPAGGIFLRGTGTARPGGEVRTYTDGAPRGSGMWSHPLMDSLPLDFAESVSVQKTPHPARYADTFGAVDIETRRRRDQGTEGELDLAYGRHNTLLSASSAGLKEGFVDAYGGMTYKYSEGAREHDRAILKGTFARLGADLTDSEHLGFVYQRTDSRVEDPGECGKPTPRTDRFDLTTDFYTLRLDVARDTLEGYSLVYCERGLIDWWQDDLCRTPRGLMDGDAHTEWLNGGLRNFYDWNAASDFWLTGGFDLAVEDGETETRNVQTGLVPFVADGQLATLSGYLGGRFDFALTEDWTLTPSAGARAYLHSKYDSKLAPTAALMLDWREMVQTFVTGSRGVHYPGVYTRAVSTDYARDTLAPETLDTITGGTKIVFDESLDALVTVFHTDVQNRIDKTARGYVNAGGMRATGVELSGHWQPTEALAIFAALTYTNPETRPVSRLPMWTVTAGATWKICSYLKLTVDGQYLDEMNAYSVRASSDAAELRALEAGFLMSARVAVPLESLTGVKGELYAALENLTNADYAYYPGYPLAGLMAVAGCRIRF